MSESTVPATPAADAAQAGADTSDMSLDQVWNAWNKESEAAAEPAKPRRPKADEDQQSEQGTSDDAPSDADDALEIDEDEDLEPADDDDGSEDDDESAKDPKADLHKVKVDGEELEITYDELVKGYQLAKASNKRLAAVAEERKALEKDRGEVSTAAQRFTQAVQEAEARGKHYDTLISQLSEVVNEQAGQFENIDWQDLAENNPHEFIRKKAQYDAFAQKQRVLSAEKARRAEEAANAASLESQQRAQKLVSYLNENFGWADAKKRDAELGGILKMAKDVGYTEQDLANTADPRAWNVLRDAYRYRQAVQRSKAARGQDAQPEAPSRPQPVKVAKAASRPSHQTQRATEVSALARRASQTGSIDDVFAWDQAERGSRRRA